MIAFFKYAGKTLSGWNFSRKIHHGDLNAESGNLIFHIEFAYFVIWNSYSNYTIMWVLSFLNSLRRWVNHILPYQWTHEWENGDFRQQKYWKNERFLFWFRSHVLSDTHQFRLDLMCSKNFYLSECHIFHRVKAKFWRHFRIYLLYKTNSYNSIQCD